MKIALLCSGNNTKYVEVANAIKTLDLVNQINIIQDIIPRKKYDIYVVFSDEIDQCNKLVSAIKNNKIIITSNLSEEFISAFSKKVQDIIYMDLDETKILDRIIGNCVDEKVNSNNT